MKITTVGIDLAKNVFQATALTSKHGKAVLTRQLRPDQMAAFFVNLSPVPDRHGSLCQHSPLGAQIGKHGPHRAVDSAVVR